MTTRYELIIYLSNDDDSFSVEVPELPGCMDTALPMPKP